MGLILMLHKYHFYMSRLAAAHVICPNYLISMEWNKYTYIMGKHKWVTLKRADFIARQTIFQLIFAYFYTEHTHYSVSIAIGKCWKKKTNIYKLSCEIKIHIGS